jgi:integrase
MPRRKPTLPDFLHDLTPPAKHHRIKRDPSFPGFGVRITAAGARAWVYDYGRVMTLGQYEDLTYEAARERASAARQCVKDGGDPLAEREQQHAAPTFNDLIEHWRKVDRPKNRATSNYEYDRLIAKQIKPLLGPKKASDLTRAKLRDFHRTVSERTPTQANRALTLTKRIFQLAIDDEKIAGPNPARGVELNHETPRNPMVPTEQFKILIHELDAEPHRRADKNAGTVIKLAALTGARIGEVVASRWGQFDLRAGTWAKPAGSTKQARLHFVPLNTLALSLVADLYNTAEKDGAGKPISEWVFPSTGRSRSGHTSGAKRLWTRARRTAGLTDLRLHDLRHLYASQLVSSGVSLPIIGNLLGHATPAVTQRYAHVHLDPARAATERYSAFVDALTGGKPAAEVIDHPRTRREGNG